MKTIAIDLDGVLCKETKPYVEAKPIKKNINKTNKLAIENKIIIFTSRRICDKKLTEKWLSDNEVCYDKLILGKPKFDIYIDEKRKIQGW